MIARSITRSMARSITLAFSLALCTGSATAAADRAPAAPPLPAAFETLKTLAGTWQGSAKMGDQTIPVTFVYEVTAGGTAVVERLFPGTPHEMMSVYTVEGDRVIMTHYCAMGNHPKMVLKTADARSLAFEAKGAEGLRAATEPHMHAMSVSFVDGAHVRETWTSFDKGAMKETKTFDLARKT
jgi:hypothetical protein